MKILITGANGLLGQKLVGLLAEKEVEIIATGKGNSRLPNPDTFTYVTMDICNANEVMETIKTHQPDVIVNTAAMTQVDQCETEKEACWDLNVNAVEHLIKASEANNAFLLHLSTDFIFDGADGPYDEEASANPLSYYGESKLAAEELLQKSNIRWAIARTVLVYGIAHDMSRSNIILWVKNSIEQGKDLKIVDDQWRTPTLAEDLAMGCWLIAEKQAEGVFNISGKDLLTPYDMAMMTCDYFQLDKSYIEKVDGSIFQQTAKRPAKTGFNINKAREILGYEPHSFEEGIKILHEQISAQ
ncbi:SDR family oxidoreductase [Persicobacter diffluens]|uniref:dTDP-4-dehydrorhamnose reductase n=1 Tax=Persicobacter diffluens TaxID=981 RepID=A0AAN4VVM8_9BACT|nr:NAD(P)-dependent oxidoreductase [Persicobacter diffluens]